MATIRTLAIGGGIGGLSLAREFIIRGLPVVVLERAPQLNPVGAGIIMNPNAMRVLEENGLADAVRQGGWPYMIRETYDRRGNLLAIRDYRPLYSGGKISIGALVHRAHLLHVLYEGLRSGVVRFGVRVRKIDLLPDAVRVETDQGEIFEADLLVGADGIHSQVRDHVFGVTEPLYMGYRSHRFVVENSLGMENFTEFLGRGKRIGLVPISKNQLYVWTTFNSPIESREFAMTSADRFREFFGEFKDERVGTAFSQLESTDGMICTDVEEIRQGGWVKERAALLGDAAHAVTPNIGQGAGMAMEDAAVLAQEVDAARDDPRQLPEALGRYVIRRRSRVENVMRLSRQVGAEGQKSNPIACWLRNHRIRQAGRNAPRMLEELERLLAYRI
jgi:2-polyprenyl-6-methoxyphenol hydroxylase-like FAD-dependent oxidoreductase